MKKLILPFLVISFFICSLAKANDKYPNLEGKIYMESRIGFVNDESVPDTYNNSATVNIEPNFSLNINEGWSIKTQWKLSPVEDRKIENYEIGNVFPSNNYPDNIDDYGLVIEELKGDYRGEDLNFFFGKYNPTFGEAWKKDKRIGIFTSDFTEDYELREKIGLGVAALLDDGAVTLNLFFNDTTGLSNSAINKRGKNNSSDNKAGNNNNLSSYSITISGNNFFDIEDLRYNFGYSDLDVENQIGIDNQKGMVGGFEYLIPINYKTFIIPLIEIAKIDNFTGIEGKDILYSTTSLAITYSNWKAGVTGVVRDIKSNNFDDYTDSQIQYFIGYKFQNGINLDATHMVVKENNQKAKIFGVGVSYLYEF